MFVMTHKGSLKSNACNISLKEALKGKRTFACHNKNPSRLQWWLVQTRFAGSTGTVLVKDRITFVPGAVSMRSRSAVQTTYCIDLARVLIFDVGLYCPALAHESSSGTR
jgi:hypothetical protein